MQSLSRRRAPRHSKPISSPSCHANFASPGPSERARPYTAVDERPRGKKYRKKTRRCSAHTAPTSQAQRPSSKTRAQCTASRLPSNAPEFLGQPRYNTHRTSSRCFLDVPTCFLIVPGVLMFSVVFVRFWERLSEQKSDDNLKFV